MSKEREQKYGEAIWTASRNDESTISATGANIVARAVMAVADAEQAELRAAANALAVFARYHAMHADVSKGDRARIAELCDQIQGCDARLDSQRIVAACAAEIEGDSLDGDS